MRARIDAWITGERAQRVIMTVIIVNAVVLGAQTTAWGARSEWLSALDIACLSIFVAELVVKLSAQGGRFFRSGWNVFDLIVVAVALIPASSGLAVLRALRVLRLVSIVKKLRFVVAALAASLPGIASIGALLVITFYVGSVMATTLFTETFPEWFGSIARSAYSLFQVMTLESWSMGIVRPVMEVHPWAWAFFVPFIVISAFTVLNLLVAVIVDAMQAGREEEAAAADADDAQPRDELAELREQVASLQTSLDEALDLLRPRREDGGPSSGIPSSAP